MILLSHPTGNANVRAVAAALLRHEMLFRFATCLALPATISRRRTFDVPPSKVWRRPLRELARHAASRVAWRGLVEHEVGWASMDAVGRDLDAFVARKLSRVRPGEVTGVYCYEDFARRTFEVAQARSIKRIYDLPIAHWQTSQRLLREQAERWPAWEPTLGGTRDSEAKLARKDEELALADIVITPSKFVFDSLPASARDTKKCVLAEFGSPVVKTAKRALTSGPLRLLFVGAMTQRKGLADLFAAMKLLDSHNVELVVLGSPILPMSFYRGEFAHFIHEPPRPQRAVLELMKSCDVFVLPSIVEGRALVQQEAMACGLPIIVTRNTGGDDLVDEGRTGFIVPINSPESLAERISWFSARRSELPSMSEAARAKAINYTWVSYGEKVINAIAA